MEPQKPGSYTVPEPKVVKRQSVAKKRATQRVHSWSVQNDMRGVLGQVFTGTAVLILDSANPRKIRT